MIDPPTVGPLDLLPAGLYHYFPVGKLHVPEGVSGAKGQPCSEKPQRAEAAGQRLKGSRLDSASVIPPAVPGRNHPSPALACYFDAPI